MGKLSVQDKVCIFICWALTLICGGAEQEYFIQTTNLTWDEARNHCQVCFKELMTLTPANIQTIAPKLTSDYWVGLRKNLNSSTSNSSMPWTRWANGDPLTFQNWYPGWPVLKSPLPKRDCCSCSCTCPEPDTTGLWESTIQNMTGWGNTTLNTSVPVEATCMRKPMTPPDEPDTNQTYIEDSCVAMLRFGTWVERNCSERLPFICYEDLFIGQASVTDVTSRSAILTWLPAPGGISHYRVEVQGDKNLTEKQTSLMYHLRNLTEGTRYSVQVFPVKCERVLNPQRVTFYTPPNKVESLTNINVTETSISLSWKPAGNNFYRIDFLDKQIESYTAGTVISNLIPGNSYTFTVRSVVADNSTWSEGSSITVYTKPGKVTNLRVSENTKNSLLLNWVPPEGKVTGFWVTAVNDTNDMLFEEVNQPQSPVRVTGLPMGTKITLSVTALANGTLKGDKVTVFNYTAPGQISNLILTAGNGSISAMWDPPVGNYSFFTIKLQLDDITVKTLTNLTKPQMKFDSLKTAAYYTVIVYSVSGHIVSLPVQDSKFTLPAPPTEPKVTAVNETHMTFQWKAPDNVATVKYHLNIRSSFWSQNWTVILENKNSHTFGGLNSGTKYEFEVRTVAESLSIPAKLSYYTDADKREVSLSMLCSSQQPLVCDDDDTRQSVFEQLKFHFKDELKDNIFWELVPATGNTGP